MKRIELFQSMIPFRNLPSIDGRNYSSTHFKKHRLLGIIFLGIECPYSRNSIPEINRISARFAEHMDIVAINPYSTSINPNESLTAMKDFVQKHNILFQFLKDENQVVAKAYGAQWTPEVFLFDKNHKLVYIGRLNDNPLNISSITRHDLTNALEELFRIKKVLMPITEPIGTPISWINY